MALSYDENGETIRYSLYGDYLYWRSMGFRAISAYYIAKYGFWQYLGAVEGWDY